MRYSKECLTEIASDELIKDRIEGNPTYDWVDIVAIPQRPEELKNSIYLATHSQGEEGWDKGFDRRPQAEKVAKDKGWHLAVEEGFDSDELSYLQVKSLNTLAQRIYENARSKSAPYVIGVTGSVGKTTTVAFLEEMVKESGIAAARFYSKRLTPHSVMCHYINRVNEETSIVIMEYSAYLREHIHELSKLLPPDIAFMLNIYDTHLNPEMFRDKKDIYDSKVKIKPAMASGYVNKRILSELNIPTSSGWSDFEVEMPDVENENLPPTLRTAELFTVGKILSEKLGIRPEVFRRAYADFIPKESRILTVNVNGNRLFFHGETSGGGRLWSWFETLDGSEPWLLVEKIDFADEDPRGFENLLQRIFSSPQTFVLDTMENREVLPVGANFVTPSEFGTVFNEKANGYVVYHKALAVRQAGFDAQQYLSGRW